MKEIHRTVVQLRQQEKSYHEIQAVTGLAKSTISWVLARYFPEKRNKNIASKLDRARGFSEEFQTGHRARYEAAQRMHQEKRQQLCTEYLRRLREYHDQTLVWYVAGLYDGEGTHGDTSFDLANSDPCLIRSFIRLLRDALLIERERYVIELYLHGSQDAKGCESYWSQHLHDHVDRVYQYDNRPQKKVHNHNHPRPYFGTLRIRVKQPNGLKLALQQYRPQTWSG